MSAAPAAAWKCSADRGRAGGGSGNSDGYGTGNSSAGGGGEGGEGGSGTRGAGDAGRGEERVRDALRSVCVFCGSLAGGRPGYMLAARELGAMLARRGIELVYGGGHVGMMGALADAALAAGGRVVGIIPQHLMQPEVAHQKLAELRVVDSMHQRKQLMSARADAFAVLPGGYGTFEEMFEMITWRQLQLHAKPVGLVNVEGYFDHLLAFLRHAVAEGFIRPQHQDLLLVDDSVARLLDRLSERAAELVPTLPARGTAQS